MRISATGYPLPVPYHTLVPGFVEVSSDNITKTAAYEAEATRLKVLVSPLLTLQGSVSSTGITEFVSLMRQAHLEGEVYFMTNVVCKTERSSLKQQFLEAGGLDRLFEYIGEPSTETKRREREREKSHSRELQI